MPSYRRGQGLSRDAALEPVCQRCKFLPGNGFAEAETGLGVRDCDDLRTLHLPLSSLMWGTVPQPSSPTAGDPCSRACATRTYAVPRAAAGACGQASTPTCVRASRRDGDANGAALGYPAASSTGHDTIANFNTETGTWITGATPRSDLHAPAAV